jgi:hypothetical protein
MGDGVRLATDVYLPEARPPFPAVLVRLPYDKAGPLAYMTYVAEYLTAHGYAVVLQDVRGKIRSEGKTFAFVHEMRDGYDTIDWVASQSWCNGRVGMYGDSYYGFTQWAAAAAGHPALRAIVPRLTGSDIGEVWMYPGGVFRLATMAWWGAYTWVDRYLYDVEPDWSVRPFADLVPHWLGGARSPSLDRWVTLRRDSQFWAGIYGGRSAAAVSRVPALNVGGWFDVFHRGSVRDWRAAGGGAGARRAGVGAARRCATAPQHLLLDAIDHYDDQLLADGEEQPDMYESPESLRAFVPRPLEPAVAFLDRHLKGAALPELPAVRWRLVGAGWRESGDWPPPEARQLRLYLGDLARAAHGPEGGTLSSRPPGTPGAAEWRHDPDDLVPSLDAEEWRYLLGLPDEREVEVRDDVLTFTAEAVERPLDLAGPVEAALSVCSTGPALDVVLKLVDVFPSGRARRIAEGAARADSAGREVPVAVDMGHAGYRLDPGHALRLEVASSAFPRYLPYPGSDADPWLTERTNVNHQTLLSSGTSPSFVRLTVVPTT